MFIKYSKNIKNVHFICSTSVCFSSVLGEEYINMFFEYTRPSLLMADRNISSNLYAITNSMLSTYVVYPIEDDFNYFSKCLDLNMWDRG